MSKKPLMERYKPSKKFFQRHIEQIMLVLAVLLVTLPHLLIVWDCQARLTTISADALYSLFSTSASVVAGLYGITLTGYIFFLEHIQRDNREDETLSDPIELLKRDYNRLAIFITVLAFLSLMANGFQLLYGAENTLLPEGVHRFLMDETLWLTSATIFCIMCFILLVVAPDKIQRISERYKRRIDGSGSEEGDLEQFLQDYGEIEEILRKLAGKIGSSIRHLGGTESGAQLPQLRPPLLRQTGFPGNVRLHRLAEGVPAKNAGRRRKTAELTLQTYK